MRRKFGYYLTIVLALTYCLGGWALTARAKQQPAELRSTLQDQQQVAVTIYNGDLALIKDRRRVQLPAGESLLALREVSGGMMAETALLRQLDGKGDLQVVEQNFDYDLLTPQKLLEKYVGQTVRVVRVHPQSGAETLEEATVLAANGGVVLRMGDRIETGVPGRLVFPDVPANLRDRPTLVVRLANSKAGSREIELSYLSSGLSWRADYVAELSVDDSQLDLSGWVTLDNRSGSTYRNALLQLVAGEVNRVRPALLERAAFDGRAVKTMAAAPAMAEESLLDYHLYTLDRPTTIGQNQVKQVALLGASAVPVRKEYLLRGSEYYYRGLYGKLGEKLKAAVYLEFDNRQQDGLGLPLPKGILRVYKNDRAGNAQFVGEDRIDHTAKNQTVRLQLGAAFDVTAQRTQTDFKKLASGARENLIESAYLIELSNATDKAVTVKVAEPLPGDWAIVEESLPHRKEDARTAVWQVEVPAEGKVLLTYRARVRY
jgi:hypothetical protein